MLTQGGNRCSSSPEYASWHVEGEGINLVSRLIDEKGGLVGFALTGDQIGQKSKLQAEMLDSHLSKKNERPRWLRYIV